MSEPSPLPPIAGAPLSVLLLVGNPGVSVSDTVTAWQSELQKRGEHYEIIVVSPEGQDGHSSLVPEGSAIPTQVRMVSYPGPPALGAALRAGLAAASHPLLLYTTCDRQYQPADLQRFLPQIEHAHLVSGFRLCAPVPLGLRWLGAVYRGFVRVLIGQSLKPLPGWLGWRGQVRRLLARLFFGVRLHDVDCAFRLFRRSIFVRIPIQSDGAFAQVEILAKANFLGCLMSEEPVSHRPPVAPEAEQTRSPLRQTVKEAYRLLTHPDFGTAEGSGPAPQPPS